MSADKVERGNVTALRPAETIVAAEGAIGRRVRVSGDITKASEAHRQLAANAATFEAMVRNNPFGVYVVDSDFRLMHASLGTVAVFAGIDPLIGRDFDEILRILWVEPLATEFAGHFRRTLATGETYLNHTTVGERQNSGEVEAYDWRVDRIVLPDGTFGVVCYFYDLSERIALEERLKQALADKDMLLREIDHRVRNSIAVIASLLSMQAGAASSIEVQQALDVAANRLTAIARIHERLYLGKHVGIIEFGAYLEEICADLSAALRHGEMTMVMDIAPCTLPVDQAVPLGLIANELVTNAFKHCGDDTASVKVELRCSDTTLTLTVSDSGMGMPAHHNPAKRTGLGMRVITSLVRQLQGSLALPAAGTPARFEIAIPIHCASETPVGKT